MAVKKKGTTDEYSFIIVKVENIEISLNSGMNFETRGFFVTGENDRIYSFGSNIEITGECIYPEDRMGQKFIVTLAGSSKPSDHLELKLKDLMQLDRNGAPVYKKYKDRIRPVYKEPIGLALVDKVRGENKWLVYLQVDRQMISDSLVLASYNRQLYLSVHEKKSNRQRWVRNFSLGTTNPLDE